MIPQTKDFRVHGWLIHEDTSIQKVDLSVIDGRISFLPSDKPYLFETPVYILPGLVDSHTHVDYPQELVSPAQRESFVRKNLMQMSRAGTLLLRDLGASSQTLSTLPTHPQEPQRIHSGRAMIGCRNACFSAISAKDVISTASKQSAQGLSWVKIFADWPHPSIQDDSKATYFRADNPLTYPADVLKETVAAAHREGARVAAHAFTLHGARACIDANVDSIEHGWGITLDMIPELIEKNIAWVPLLSLSEGMKQMALRDDRPDQIQWVEACWEHLGRVLPEASKRGVCILGGTDWFPAVTLATEVQHMIERGMTPTRAVMSISTAARRFLGYPIIEEGAPADICLFHDDPRAVPSRLCEPDWICVSGVPLRPERPQIPTPPKNPHHHLAS